MEDKSENSSPDISGVPKEIQSNILSDLEKKNLSISLPLKKIGMSVSENEDLGFLGYSNVHLRDLTLEIARHVLINNYILVYGGDLRREGFTEMFADLAYQYRSIGSFKTFYFENYFAYPIYCSLTRQNELEFKKSKTNVIKVHPPKGLEVNPDVYTPPSTVESKLVWAKCLTHMRTKMILGTHARILIGGKCNNYLGKLPGIIEEAKITLAQDKPLYLIGAFGGASRQIIDAIKGQDFSFLNSDFHISEDYERFKKCYDSKFPEEKIDLHNIQAFFCDYGLTRIANNNGLTREENVRLFETPHLSEIVYLLFKGLNKIFS